MFLHRHCARAVGLKKGFHFSKRLWRQIRSKLANENIYTYKIRAIVWQQNGETRRTKKDEQKKTNNKN